MALSFGTFVPQGWRLDLIEIADPGEKYEATERVRATYGWSVEELQRSAVVGTPEQAAPLLK